MPRHLSLEVGLVVIGRNEGSRLVECLRSRPAGLPAVYVDSGSIDGSSEVARVRGLETVQLDRSAPFTAARARNAGAERLFARWPEVRLVQFLDGDCTLVDGWLEPAVQVLQRRPGLAAVCGRRRERYPNASIFNQLCDLEWDQPPGETDAFGGDVLLRAMAFREVGGFNPTLIAGEEPELALRLRRRGWKILRLPAEMAEHDAAIYRAEQWWRRSVRAGFAYAEGAALHGRCPERYCLRETARCWFWAALLPTLALGLLRPSRGGSLLLGLGYAWPGLRAYQTIRRRGRSAADARLYALACLVGKLPELVGQLSYWTSRLRNARRTLIEYHAPEQPVARRGQARDELPRRAESAD